MAIVPIPVEAKLQVSENQTMKYMDVATASEKWGITGRRIRILCNDGRIDGAVRNGWTWQIPSDTPKPGDGRVLRKFRNLDIRPGFVDVAALEKASLALPVESSSTSFFSSIPSTVSFLFSAMGKDVSARDVATVLSGELSYSLTLQQHLLIVNFTSILRSLFKKREKWNGGRLKEIYIRLLQGISEVDGEYEREMAKGGRGEEVSVKAAMENTLTQYEYSWSSLHPLSSALILTGEIMKVRPYISALPFYYYLILSGELLRGGLLPPLLDVSIMDEAKAAFSLCFTKGIYTDLTTLMERMEMRTYRELEENV